MLRLLLSAVVGFFAASVLLAATDLDGGWWWATGASGAAMTVLLVVVSLGRAFAGTSLTAPQDVEAALRENRVSLARVLDVRATGTTINDQPLCEIRLTVAARTRPPYTTTTRSLVNLGRLPSLQRGSVVVVAQLDRERPDVALLDPPPADWQQLADRDTSARSMPEAPAWESAPARGRDRNGLLRIPGILLLVAVLVGFGARLWPVRQEALDLVQGTPLEQVRAQGEAREAAAASIFPAERTQQVVDDLVEAADGARFTEILLFQTYAVAEGLTTPDAVTTDSFTWRDGTATREGAALIQPEPGELEAELFDAGEVDWSLVAALVDQVPTLTGITDADGPSVQVRRADDPEAGNPLQIFLSTNDDYYDAYLTADTTGAIVGMSGGRPGSQAEAWAAAHAG